MSSVKLKRTNEVEPLEGRRMLASTVDAVVAIGDADEENWRDVVSDGRVVDLGQVGPGVVHEKRHTVRFRIGDMEGKRKWEGVLKQSLVVTSVRLEGEGFYSPDLAGTAFPKVLQWGYDSTRSPWGEIQQGGYIGHEGVFDVYLKSDTPGVKQANLLIETNGARIGTMVVKLVGEVLPAKRELGLFVGDRELVGGKQNLGTLGPAFGTNSSEWSVPVALRSTGTVPVTISSATWSKTKFVPDVVRDWSGYGAELDGTVDALDGRSTYSSNVFADVKVATTPGLWPGDAHTVGFGVAKDRAGTHSKRLTVASNAESWQSRAVDFVVRTLGTGQKALRDATSGLRYATTPVVGSAAKVIGNLVIPPTVVAGGKPVKGTLGLYNAGGVAVSGTVRVKGYFRQSTQEPIVGDAGLFFDQQFAVNFVPGGATANKVMVSVPEGLLPATSGWAEGSLITVVEWVGGEELGYIGGRRSMSVVAGDVRPVVESFAAKRVVEADGRTGAVVLMLKLRNLGVDQANGRLNLRLSVADMDVEVAADVMLGGKKRQAVQVTIPAGVAAEALVKGAALGIDGEFVSWAGRRSGVGMVAGRLG
jgi:hypothetical protein